MNANEFLQLILASLNYVMIAAIVGAGLVGAAVFLYQLSIDIRRRSHKVDHLTSMVAGGNLGSASLFFYQIHLRPHEHEPSPEEQFGSVMDE